MSNELTPNSSQSHVVAIIQKQSEINVLETEIALMKNKLKVLQRQQEDLSNTIIAFMKNSSLKVVETHDYRVTLKEPSTVKVMVIDETLVPKEYIRTKVETSVNKEKIKIALKDGIEVPGCSLEQSEPSLLIKDKRDDYTF